MTAAAGFTFSPAHRMVDRVHGNAAVVRLLAKVAFLAGFAELDIHVFNISDLADSGAAFDIDHSDFTARELDLGVFAFFGAEHRDLTGGSDHSGAATGNHLDIVDFQADRNVLDLQAVAWLELSFFAIHDGVADLEAVGSYDVFLFAVSIEQQRDICGTVGIVFQRVDLGRNAVFAAMEVDEPEQALVAAAAETTGDTTSVISAAGSSLADGKTFFRSDVRQFGIIRDCHIPSARSERVKTF